MNREKCEISEELLPYRKFFRDINEPKYDFKSGLKTVQKRKALHHESPSRKIPSVNSNIHNVLC